MDAANQLVCEKAHVRSGKEFVELWLGQLDVALQVVTLLCCEERSMRRRIALLFLAFTAAQALVFKEQGIKAE